ncbi:serine/threonine-protein kinase, partial [Okeania sp. SIO2B9]|uniref:serine/threonine-protein kinase n=1 Tax=Okeania sp. SIO2B9 TaxID=2607782 RepID=UPI00142BA666
LDYAQNKHNQDFYLVQELIIGHDLSTEMSQPWNEAKVLNFLSEILEVLAFVHQDEVIHRDIKPGNIMRRDRDQKLMLIDFGAVKEVSNIVVNSQGKSSSTIAVGTPGYMPVEQAQGRPQFASDIYAVGITAIQALTGVTPRNFIQDELGEIDLQKLVPNISEKLANFLTKMVRVNWKQRYSDAAVALRALQGNIEPISGILNWILLKITIGLICQHKNCDFSIFQSCLDFFVDRLQQNSTSVNCELYKTVSMSLLKAQEKIAIEYRNQIGGSFPTILQYSPFHSEQKRKNLGWVNRKISKLRSEFKKINQTKYVTNFPEDISCLLIPLPPVDEIKNLCQSFILVLLQGDEPDGYLEKLQRDVGGLLNLVAVNFMQEMRDNQIVKEIFECDFLGIINQQLSGDKLTLEDLEKSLQKVRLELTELRIQQEKAKTMIISPPINFGVTLPGNSQVDGIQ